MSATPTIETLVRLRRRAEQDQVCFSPKEVLSLLDRIEALDGVVRLFMQDPRAYTPRAVAAAKAAGFYEGQ